MEYMKATLYIDFDHTLFDTESLKRAFAKTLRPFGVTERQFLFAYRRLRTKKTFSIPAFAREITHVPATRRRIIRALEQVARNGVRFLYADALPFLRMLNKRGVRCVIFTYGNPHFQRMKIASIPGYRLLFSRAVITADSRKVLSKTPTRERAYIIDNRSDVVLRAARHGITPFILQRGRTPIPRTYRAITHRSLRSIEKYII